MKKIYAIIFAILLLAPTVSFSQYSWNRFTNRNEYLLGFGASQFLGDLGGSKTIGTHFLKDFNFGSIREAFELGYRYHINPYFAAKFMLTGAYVHGEDRFSEEAYRHNRNLNFRSPIVELSAQYEYYFYRNSTIGHRYHIKHAHGFQRFAADAYIFIGFGAFWFNPQGQYVNGAWYNLRPLSTEGEGLQNGPSKYLPLAICVPIGIGFKYSINPQWNVGLEISDRIWTSSDYIDDTHGTYYDNAAIKQDRGDIAAYFADPSLGEIQQAIPPNGTGQKRGDPNHNDTYMFTYITVSYSPPFRRRTRSKF